MLKSKYILFAVFLLAAAGVSAQKAERDYIRKAVSYTQLRAHET